MSEKGNSDSMKKCLKRGNISGAVFVVLVVIVLALLLGFVVLRPTSSKYKSDIKKLKADKYDRYYYFPDEVPDGATGVTWIKLPSIMQGNGYETLGFYTSSEYIDQVVSTYGEHARIYLKYDEYGSGYYTWMNFFQDPDYVEEDPSVYEPRPFDVNSQAAKHMTHARDLSEVKQDEEWHTDYLHSFPGVHTIKEEHADDAVVYILYDNDDWNHAHMSGFVIVPSENYILYFCE